MNNIHLEEMADKPIKVAEKNRKQVTIIKVINGFRVRVQKANDDMVFNDIEDLLKWLRELYY